MIDIDYQRSIYAFGAVDTHYIIQVRATPECDPRFRFKTFNIEKSFHDFRNLVTEFRRASKDATEKVEKTKGWEGVPESTQNLIAFSDAFAHVIDSEPISHFIGKMTFSRVQELAVERRKTLDKALRVLTENYPTSEYEESRAMKHFKQIVNDFFLTDHIYDELAREHQGLAADATVKYLETKPIKSPSPPTDPPPPPPPLTQEDNFVQGERWSGKSRGVVGEEATELNSESKATTVSGSSPFVRPKSVRRRAPVDCRKSIRRQLIRTKTLTFSENEHHRNMDRREPEYLQSPATVLAMFFGLILFFLWLPKVTIELQLDGACVLMIICAAVGMSLAPESHDACYHTHIGGEVMQSRTRVDSETLMRMSLGNDKPAERSLSRNCSIFTYSSDLKESSGKSPIQKFPKGAEIGSILNCWSEPVAHEFKVRGPNYLKDRIKIPSGPFLFPARGVDIFLSDCCPEHIARYKAILGGKLREKATFVINYRLPWGNCVTYSEIPSKFLPFLRYCYDKSLPLPSVDGLTNAEVCACRYLMADDKGKDQILKIVPKVVKGPWIVKKTCDGKPAIVCKKMPTQYFYEAATDGKAEYLEVDLDIVASSAARAILSVAQRYTKSLTLDLGFVLQGNSPDELPEQMAFGSRLHGLDPLTAPMLPQSVDGSL